MTKKIPTNKDFIISIDTKNEFIYLKDMNGRKFGSCSYAITNGNEFYISDFTIVSNKRNKGWGKMFARVILAIAKSMGMKMVTLIDGSTIPKFWQNLGFYKLRTNKYAGEWGFKLGK